MLVLLGTAGGFGGHFDAHPDSYALAPDAGPKLIVAGVLLLALGAWIWATARSLRS